MANNGGEDRKIVERQRGVYAVENQDSQCFEVKWDKTNHAFRPKAVSKSSLLKMRERRRPPNQQLPKPEPMKQSTFDSEQLEKCIPNLQRILLDGIDFKTVAKTLQFLMQAEEVLTTANRDSTGHTIHHKLMIAKGLLYMSQIYVKFGSVSKARDCGKAVNQIMAIITGGATTESAQNIIRDAKHAIRQAIQYDQMCFKCEKVCSKTTSTTPPAPDTLCHIEEAIRIAPWSMRALRLKAVIFLAREMYQEACDFLRHSPATESDVQLSLAYARALDYSGSMDQALSTLRSLIQQYPTQIIFRQEMQRIKALKDRQTHADALFKSGHLEQAVEQYNTGVSLDPQHKAFQALMLNRKAAVLLVLGREEEAVADLEAAIALCPEDNLDMRKRLDRAKVQLRSKRMEQMAYRERRSERQKRRVASTGVLHEAQNRSASQDFVKNLHQDHRMQQEAGAFGNHRPSSSSGSSSSAQTRRRLPHHPLQKHYDTLGLSNDASVEQVKKAYRSLALQYHPDKNPIKSAERKFRQIHSAYSILINSLTS